MGWEGQCGGEIEAIVKMKKKKSGEVRSGVRWGGGGGGWGQSGCERRIEVIVKIIKNRGGPGGVGWSGWM